jgi:hypothetical protein
MEQMEFHHEVWGAAMRSKVPDLASKAYESPCQVIFELDGPGAIVKAIQILMLDWREESPAEGHLKPRDLIKELIDVNLGLLAKDEGFRTLAAECDGILEVFMDVVAMGES